LRSVSATLKCGNDSVTQTQTITANVAELDASEAAAPVTLSFNTAAFTINSAGAAIVALHNGQCTLSANATTATSQGATNTTQLTLNNQDAVVVTNSFQAITNAEGVTQPTQANDSFGLPWRSGSVTVLAVPVLYSNRTLASVTITLPGSTNPTQTVTTAPFSATWSGSATSGSRVTGLTLTDTCVPANPKPNGCEANNNTPLGITPSVIALDNVGNDLQLTVLNATITGSSFRLDNTPPEAPLAFNTPGRQSGWVNAAYVFTGVGIGANPNGSQLGGNGSTTGTENFVSCGDGPTVTPASPGGTYVCTAQNGVSASSPGAVGVGTASSNGNTKFTYYAIPSASFVAASGTNGTSTSATACSTTGWTKITTAGDLAATTLATAYVVRVFESDALGNSRCTDLVVPPAALANLGTAINTNISGAYTANAATFGVDKVAPTDSLLTPTNPLCGSPSICAGDLGKYTTNPVPFFVNAPNDPDAASGLSATPMTTKLVRLAIDPATLAPSTVNSSFGCPIGFSNNACGTASAGTTIAADAGSSAGTSSLVDGYYTYTATVMDRARNVGPTVTRQVVVDRAVPVMGGIGIPPTITGGQTASFPASATDNLDLVGTSYLLSYAVTPTGAAAPLSIRATGNDIGVAFDNTLTTTASFTLAVPSFVRTIAATTAGLPPNATGTLAGSIAVSVVDAAGNTSLANTQAIPAANINQTALTNFATPVNGLTFNGTGFSVSNVATNISNCPAAGCAGGVAPANPTSVILTATAQGQDSPTFQFANPFTSVSWYYLSAANEWTLIGTVSAPTGAIDNVAQTQRTYSWTLPTAFDPPASLVPPGTLKIIAIGVNSKGDALVTDQNSLITITNP
jgi:hypothetical protein